MGTCTLLVGVQMGLATLKRNWEIFSNIPDAHTLQHRISTSMRFITEICTQAHRKFCSWVIRTLFVIAAIKAGSGEKQVLSREE